MGHNDHLDDDKSKLPIEAGDTIPPREAAARRVRLEPRHLDLLAPTGSVVIAAPLDIIRNGSGGPLRALALVSA